MVSKSPAYLQDLVGMEAQNQSTDYLRYQDEINKQKAEMEARRRKENSFGNRLKRGFTQAIPGMISGAAMGLMRGGPGGALAGAGIGAGAGLIGGAIGGPMGNNTASLAALGGSAIGRYMGGSGGGGGYGGGPGLPNQGYLSDEDYQRMLLDQAGGGPI